MDYQHVLVMLLLSCTAAETEPAENGTTLLQKDLMLQEAPPAVRSPVQSSQQATAFLVSGWNDWSTWRTGSKALSVCEEDIERTIKGYIANQMWALQVFDSWAKTGPSLLQGRSMFVGDYRQCRGIRSPAANDRAGFGGNYCVVSLANLTVFQIRNIIELMAFSRIQLGACLPDSCSEGDITNVFQERLEAMNLSWFLFALSTDCLSEEKEFTTFTIIALVIILLIVMLVIAGTGIELTAQFHKLTSSNHTSECQVCDMDEEENTQRVWVKALLAFSMYTNGKRLLSTSQAPGSITVIPGLRFLTMSWIVLGHAYWSMIYGRAGNLFQGNASVVGCWMFDVITNMQLAVDTFFAISGFLVSYLNMKKVLEKGWKFNWGHYFLHRYWRLTPTYMVAFTLIQGLQRFFVYGATAPTVQPSDKAASERNWWLLPLYINNIYRVEPNEVFFIHSWSLAVDFQFHLISPLMLIPFYLHRNAGVASCLFFTIAQCIISGCLAYHYKVTVGYIGQSWEYYKYCYSPFYARIGPFAIGILTGYIMSANNGCVKMKIVHISFLFQPVVVIGWILAAAAGLAVLFGVHGDLSSENPNSLWVTSMYNATFRSVWGACVCWVIVACTSGHGGPVSVFLSWSPFTVLGRLTYTGYLIQLSILAIILENLEQPPYLNIVSVVVYGTAGLVFTCAVSAILVSCVEMPTLNVEKIRYLKRKL